MASVSELAGDGLRGHSPRSVMAGGTPRRSAVALATCADYPAGHVDDVPLLALLADLGVGATFAVWDDTGVDWDQFDLVVLRSTWDYTQRRDEFLAWAESVRTLANPARAVRWSSDKRYLHDLATAGAPCIPTHFVEPGSTTDDVAAAIAGVAGTAARFVVKPSIGAGSLDAGRFDSADPGSVEIAVKHASALVDAGRTAMVQPYLDGVDASGETCLVYIDGTFSHAIRKEALLSGAPADVDGLFVDEETSPVARSDAALAAGEAVLVAAPVAPTELLYARVDLLPGPDGTPLLLELELVEPSLFMADGPGAAERFAAAIANRCRG